jgi:hypothetical protein
VLSFSTSAGRHGSGHRASETVRERLGTAMDDQAAPTWLWWLAMSAVWCGVLVALAGLSTLLGSVLLTEALTAATFGVVVVRTVLRVAGRTRDHPQTAVIVARLRPTAHRLLEQARQVAERCRRRPPSDGAGTDLGRSGIARRP